MITTGIIMLSNYDKVKNFRKQVKQVALKSMGGCCQICHYHRCQEALEFHHIDPLEKEISFNKINSWDKLYNELNKAILLCSNCHREVHYGELLIPTDYVRFDAEIADSLRNILSHRAEWTTFDKTTRIELILNSNVDFSRRGWGAKLAKLIGINSTNANIWVKKNMPEFHSKHCFKY